MEKRIVINLGQGNWQQGFATVTAQLWDGNSSVPMQFVGKLPAATGLMLLYERWQAYYRAFNANLGLRQSSATPVAVDIESDDITHVSTAEFEALCKKLKQQFNAWLSVHSFVHVERQLRTHLDASNEIQIIIEGDDSLVRRFPWHLWDFLEDYRQAEIAIGSLEHKKSNFRASKQHSRIRILLVLGDSTGIQVSRDRDLLKNLPNIEATILDEPSRAELDTHLWDEQGWDILFFAGHSYSLMGGTDGQIKINASESLAIAQLKYGLQTSVRRGLQLAIFNSCDGMGLTRELADLHIPYLIVMREPVPDQVAQTFLMSFLNAFSTGIPFHLSIRESRERLQGLEGQFPCASWLPVICQNPTADALSWRSLQGQSSQKLLKLRNTKPSFKAKSQMRPNGRRAAWQGASTILITSLLVTSLIMGVRSLSFLEMSELKAFDHFIQMQPRQQTDERILIVAIDKQDLAYQDNQNMGRKAGWSLSDTALALLIEKLAPHSPSSIGLDLSHPFEFEPNLADTLRNDSNFIGVCQSGAAEVPEEDSTPPPGIPIERIGFSDFPVDRDGVVRRALVLMGSGEPCKTTRSFSLQLAHSYLAQQGIKPIEKLPNNQRKLGQQILPRLTPNAGGYELPANEAAGYQILLNYHYADAQFSTSDAASKTSSLIIPLRNILNGTVDAELPSLVKDRIVMIGTDQLWQDRHETSSEQGALLPSGVSIHAHMLSQLLDAALGKKSLIWWWPQWAEGLWILLWATLGGVLVWCLRSPFILGSAVGASLLALYGLCGWMMFNDGWVPLIPSVIALLLSAVVVLWIKFSPLLSGASRPQDG